MFEVSAETSRVVQAAGAATRLRRVPTGRGGRSWMLLPITARRSTI
jgi:hypothetical protein